MSGDRAGEKEGEDQELLSTLDGALQRSELCRLMQELLNSYLLLEHFYMEESVKKAIQVRIRIIECVQYGNSDTPLS